MMIKVKYRGVKLQMPYDLFASIVACEGLDAWLKFNKYSSNFVSHPPLAGKLKAA